MNPSQCRIERSFWSLCSEIVQSILLDMTKHFEIMESRNLFHVRFALKKLFRMIQKIIPHSFPRMLVLQPVAKFCKLGSRLKEHFVTSCPNFPFTEATNFCFINSIEQKSHLDFQGKSTIGILRIGGRNATTR